MHRGRLNAAACQDRMLWGTIHSPPDTPHPTTRGRQIRWVRGFGCYNDALSGRIPARLVGRARVGCRLLILVSGRGGNSSRSTPPRTARGAILTTPHRGTPHRGAARGRRDRPVSHGPIGGASTARGRPAAPRARNEGEGHGASTAAAAQPFRGRMLVILSLWR